MQLHGGVGYTTERDAERYLRDARLLTIAGGPNEDRDTLADAVVERYGDPAERRPARRRDRPVAVEDAGQVAPVDGDGDGDAPRIAGADGRRLARHEASHPSLADVDAVSPVEGDDFGVVDEQFAGRGAVDAGQRGSRPSASAESASDTTDRGRATGTARSRIVRSVEKPRGRLPTG
ncbi:acyl-CoA dehydrogenase family protein [Haloplanus sp. GCM10025708]|uniref:acyl-CoA dehydrogenase family protein n=1 Tax=Haloplanus sp. GCM10025708 TaxID=3252679 RepID=UPI003615A433